MLPWGCRRVFFSPAPSIFLELLEGIMGAGGSSSQHASPQRNSHSSRDCAHSFRYRPRRGRRQTAEGAQQHPGASLFSPDTSFYTSSSHFLFFSLLQGQLLPPSSPICATEQPLPARNTMDLPPSLYSVMPCLFYELVQCKKTCTVKKYVFETGCY